MAAKRPESPAATTWHVLSRLDHDGQTYEPGDAVPLDDATGETLRALGVVSRVKPEEDAPQPAQA